MRRKREPDNGLWLAHVLGVTPSQWVTSRSFLRAAKLHHQPLTAVSPYPAGCVASTASVRPNDGSFLVIIFLGIPPARYLDRAAYLALSPIPQCELGFSS